MDFFKTLFPLIEGTEKTTITIIRKGDRLTVGFLPEMKNDDVNQRLNILNLKGTAEELDEGFFPNVTQQISVATGVQTNIEEVEKELKDLEAEEKKEAAKKKETKKPAEKKPTGKKETAKKDAGSKTKSKSGFHPATLSKELQVVCGPGPMPKTEVIKKVWDYIKKHGLQDKKEKKNINCDETLKAIFGKTTISMFEMAKGLFPHLTYNADEKASKKEKAAPDKKVEEPEQKIESLF
jgi:upstream activation factor subunit UAF30